MGLCFSDAKMFLQAKQAGASFDSVLTIGRQSLFLHPKEVEYLREVAASQGIPGSSLSGYEFGDYADDFLREFLGIRSLTILDNSPYEGAGLIHDLNEPVPEKLRNSFDAVIDAGSLEHVFNFPAAIGSMMRMAKVGGKIFITTPANNLCGHGFYQFSPELMFRVFSEDNGFRLDRVVLLPAKFPGIELVPMRTGYEVTDPVEVHGRVGLVSKTPVLMTVAATKTRDGADLSTTPPQQSDYVAMWQEEPPTPPPSGKAKLRGAVNRLPHFLRTRVMGYYQRANTSFSNRSFYRRMKL